MSVYVHTRRGTPPYRGQPLITKQKRWAWCSEHQLRLSTCPFPKSRVTASLACGTKRANKVGVAPNQRDNFKSRFPAHLQPPPDKAYIFKSAIITTLEYHSLGIFVIKNENKFTAIRMSIIKKTNKNKTENSRWRNWNFHALLVNVEWSSQCGKQYGNS